MSNLDHDSTLPPLGQGVGPSQGHPQGHVQTGSSHSSLGQKLGHLGSISGQSSVSSAPTHGDYKYVTSTGQGQGQTQPPNQGQGQVQPSQHPQTQTQPQSQPQPQTQTQPQGANSSSPNHSIPALNMPPNPIYSQVPGQVPSQVPGQVPSQVQPQQYRYYNDQYQYYGQQQNYPYYMYNQQQNYPYNYYPPPGQAGQTQTNQPGTTNQPQTTNQPRQNPPQPTQGQNASSGSQPAPIAPATSTQTTQQSQVQQVQQQLPPPPPSAASSSVPSSNGAGDLNMNIGPTVGQYQPPGIRPRVTTTMWEDEKTLCYQVDANNVSVVRRADNNMINGTKLLNVAQMTRGRRDGILKSEKVRHVVKIGSMHLKGVWIPFERALAMARREGIVDLLYPLFVRDIKRVIQTGITPNKTSYFDSPQPQGQQSPLVQQPPTAVGGVGGVGGVVPPQPQRYESQTQPPPPTQQPGQPPQPGQPQPYGYQYYPSGSSQYYYNGYPYNPQMYPYYKQKEGEKKE